MLVVALFVGGTVPAFADDAPNQERVAVI